MNLLLLMFKGYRRPRHARILGLLVVLLAFSQCQPEPVGRPPSKPASPPPFQRVWWNYFGEKLRDKDFNQRLITANNELLLMTNALRRSPPQRLLTLSLDSGKITSKREDIFDLRHFFLGGNGPDYYFSDQDRKLKRFNVQTQVMQQIGTYQRPSVSLPGDPIPRHTTHIATIFKDNEEMIDVNKVYHFEDKNDYVFVRYDLASGQKLDTHHITLPGERIGEPDWSFTPVWTGPNGEPYTVAYRSNKAIWLHAETFQGIDTLRSRGSWYPGSFAKNTAYFGDRDTRRLRALRMPGRELLWEGQRLPDQLPYVTQAGDYLLLYQDQLDVYQRHTGAYLWGGLISINSLPSDQSLSIDGYLVSRTTSPSGQPPGQIIQFQDPATGHVHQVLKDLGFIRSMRYHSSSGTLLIFSSKGIYAYRRSA